MNTARDVLLIWGSAGIVFLICDAQKISGSLTMTPGYQLKINVFPKFEYSQGIMGSSHSHKIIFGRKVDVQNDSFGNVFSFTVNSFEG